MPLSSEITATGDKSSCTWAPTHTVPLSPQRADAACIQLHRGGLLCTHRHIHGCTAHEDSVVNGVSKRWKSREKESKVDTDPNTRTVKHCMSKHRIKSLNWSLKPLNVNEIISNLMIFFCFNDEMLEIHCHKIHRYDSLCCNFVFVKVKFIFYLCSG